jgi:hypothetical protein
MKINTILRTTLAALLTVGSTIAPISSFAGATVYRDNLDSGLVCGDVAEVDTINVPTGVLYHICYQGKGTWMQVTSPSGNVNYMLKGTSFTSVSSGVNSSQTTVESNEKWLFKPGQLRKGHSFTQTDIVSSYNGQCQKATTEYDYAFVNGNVIQDNYSFTLGPC